MILLWHEHLVLEITVRVQSQRDALVGGVNVEFARKGGKYKLGVCQWLLVPPVLDNFRVRALRGWLPFPLVFLWPCPGRIKSIIYKRKFNRIHSDDVIDPHLWNRL